VEFFEVFFEFFLEGCFGFESCAVSCADFLDADAFEDFGCGLDSLVAGVYEVESPYDGVYLVDAADFDCFLRHADYSWV